MANETELSNVTTVGNAISALMSPAFKEAAIMPNLIHMETFRNNTNVIKFRKSGDLTAATLAESTAYTFSASSELTDSSVSCTAVKGVVMSKITQEALRFGGGQADTSRIAAEQGRAIARLFDDTALALFSGFSTQVTASSILTVAKMLEAQYRVYNGNVPVDGRLTAVLDYKGAHEIRAEIAASSASAYVNPAFLDILNGTPQANNYVGNVVGIDVFQSIGLPTSASDDVALVFNPRWAFCAGVGGAFETEIARKLSEGLYYEVASWMFFDIKEWNDAAGVGLLSDT